ncbi:MAG: putative RNA methylase [Crocinitomicaceae bacterium]|jgi:predicted RNA methylase
MTKELKTISSDLIHSQSIKKEINAIENLGLFYYELLTILNIKADSRDFTNTPGGVALSPQHAIDCLKDGVRTSRFLKGIFKAITQALETNKDTPLEVLYAGCGPLSTLIIPLLPHFNSDQLRITLIDIHEESMTSSKKIIEHLELNDFFVSLKTCDATKYAHPRKIDLLITETMDKGLTREPQASISEHLCQQLSTEGILIPKQISLYTGTAVYSELPRYNPSVTTENVAIDIEHKQSLFSVNLNSQITYQGFESNDIAVPENINATPDICVFAEVEIFDGISLKVGDSILGDPICVGNFIGMETSHYSLNYTSKPAPSWSIKQKNGTE